MPDIQRVRDIIQRLRELGIPEEALTKIEKWADKEEEIKKLEGVVMTKEGILAMEAGEKLDALVAEWKDGHYHDWKGESVLHGGFALRCTKCGAFREDGRQLPNQHYSTDISAAWQVWLAVTKDGPENWAIYSDNDGKVTVEHYPDFCVDGLFPEAICKAALLAKLETVNA